jgi:hypothetical protein
MESFLSLLPKNVLDRHWCSPARNSAWPSRPGPKGRITAGDGKRRLGKLTPIEYETINRTALLAA